MQDNNIYIIQNKEQNNLVTIYTNFLRPKLNTNGSTFQIVSIKDKFQKRITLQEILEFDTTAQSLTVDTKKYISKMISKHNNENILELYKEIPDFSTYFDELTDEQKVIFSFLRSIIKDSDTIIIERIDHLVRKKTFRLLKKSISKMSKERQCNFLIESATPEYWSDTCSYYINTNETSIELVKNRLDTNKEEIDQREEVEYQIAL